MSKECLICATGQNFCQFENQPIESLELSRKYLTDNGVICPALERFYSLALKNKTTEPEKPIDPFNEIVTDYLAEKQIARLKKPILSAIQRRLRFPRELSSPEEGLWNRYLESRREKSHEIMFMLRKDEFGQIVEELYTIYLDQQEDNKIE